jgi:CubicO group peptidase (beta-lactamase class C family)
MRPAELSPIDPTPDAAPLNRRGFVLGALAAPALLGVNRVFAQTDKWGASAGYATGWGSPRRFSFYPALRVGNYSGGFETMLPNHTAQCGAELPLVQRNRDDIRYRWGFSSRTVDDYLNAWPVTGLLIARRGEVWAEKYRFDRNAEMRMTGWSMSKSVTSLLVGIAIDKGLIASLDNTPAQYVPALAGTLHGETTLRNLMNMSSGAAVVHDVSNQQIYPNALTNNNSSIANVVRGWNERLELAGTRFNYNELCPLTVGLVLRAVTGKSLAAFAQEQLWIPMGAEANATWLTDSTGQEFNCIGFAARLRDWARLGQLVAQRGEMNGKRVVSRAWMDSYSRWDAVDAQVRFDAMAGRKGVGYKNFMWHAKADGSQPYFNGADGQRVFVDLPTQTVLVQTGVDSSGDWPRELGALFQAVVAMG